MNQNNKQLSEKEKESFMQRAVELSEFGMKNNLGGPFGAVVVKNGKIIGEGHNKVQSLNDPTAHAEIIAIREACKNINSFNLSEAVIFSSCEPCPMCLSAIYWANIEEIYYANSKEDANKAGFRDDFLYNEFKKPTELKEKIFFKMENPKAKEIFEKWILKPDKIEY